MIYGGIITPAKNVPNLEKAIQEWRDKNNFHGEIKWTKVSKAKLSLYAGLVNFFFKLAEKHQLHFKAVVFDTTEIDYATYHKGDEDLGFYKFYYFFLLHKFGTYAKDDTHLLWIFLDQRSGCESVKLGTLRNVVNAGIRKKYGRKADVVRRVEARVSHECSLMQLADVLMGAVGYHCNDLHEKPGASPSKTALAAQIAKRAGVATLKQQTRFNQAHFDIWQFKFSGKKKQRPNP
jgi:hypothetical protein